MTGNAIEEGLLRQIDNPSHTDRGRISVPAGVIVGGLVAFFLTGPLFLRVLIGLAAGVTVFILLSRQFARRAMEAEARRQEAARVERMKDVEKQIAAARGSHPKG